MYRINPELVDEAAIDLYDAAIILGSRIKTFAANKKLWNADQAAIANVAERMCLVLNKMKKAGSNVPLCGAALGVDPLLDEVGR